MIQVCGGNTIIENWKPKELETIDCVYEKDKPFDFFRIKLYLYFDYSKTVILIFFLKNISFETNISLELIK